MNVVILLQKLVTVVVEIGGRRVVDTHIKMSDSKPSLPQLLDELYQVR